MKYRKEIDGLRAVAVVPVILFHAGFSLFSGGFVGVDVFFVISGYLITSILITDLEQGNFSIARFYERRARRILPALIVVIYACLPFAYMWMLPSQLEDFAASIVSVVFSISNIYFLSQVSYFAPNAELQPLLHTWSLAIEEQYYLLFPLMLLSMRRFRRRSIALTVVMLVFLGFAFAEWASRENSARSFFFSLSRFWEIGVGSICAFIATGKEQRSNNLLGAAGLALIIFSLLFYDESTRFPSAYTLVPVLGTALVVLFASERTWVGRLLSMRAFVGIGLISYSAYLWHQPFFAFARLRSLIEPSSVLMGTLAILAVLMAWATWYFVEQPFRRRTAPFLLTRENVFGASGFVGLVLVVIGFAGYFGRGFEWRFGSDLLAIAAAENDRAGDLCHFHTDRQLTEHPYRDCLSTGDKPVDVMLIGDSHMWSLADGLSQALNDANIPNYFVSYTSCLPLLGFQIYGAFTSSNCEGFLSNAYDWAQKNRISTVVIGGKRYGATLCGEA